MLIGADTYEFDNEGYSVELPEEVAFAASSVPGFTLVITSPVDLTDSSGSEPPIDPSTLNENEIKDVEIQSEGTENSEQPEETADDQEKTDAPEEEDFDDDLPGQNAETGVSTQVITAIPPTGKSRTRKKVTA